MKKTAFIYIIIAGLLWASSGIFVKFLAPLGFTSLQMTAVRGGVSLIAMAAFLLIRDRSLFVVKPRQLLLFAVMGICLFVTSSSFYTSMQLTGVSTATVLLYTTPIYVTAVSMLFLGERRSLGKVVAILAIVVGCALVSGIAGGFELDTVGIALGALSGLAYAVYNIIAKISMKRGCDPLTLSLYSFLFMTLSSLPFSSPQSFVGSVAEAPVKSILLLIGLGICTYVLPFFLYNTAMKHLSAGTASSLSVVEPLSATIYSAVLFGEQPDAFASLGIGLVLVAVVFIGIIENSDASK